MRRRVTGFYCAFLRDETAQGTVEYIFAIMIVLAVAVLAIRDFLRPLLERVSQFVEKQLGESLFTNFHRYRR